MCAFAISSHFVLERLLNNEATTWGLLVNVDAYLFRMIHNELNYCIICGTSFIES